MAELVLLTGATGFIGFRALAKLLNAGYKVRVAVRTVAGFEKIKALPSAAPYESQIEHIIVPDITVPGAYDEAVKGVTYILHLASPFASPDLFEADFNDAYVRPAVKGTLGMLDSANTVDGIERVVISSSVLAIAGFQIQGTDLIVNENHRSANAVGPFPNWVAAYAASKALAFEGSKKWIEERKPSFDLINILPGYVLGPDETAVDEKDLLQGSNASLLYPMLGVPADRPKPGITVHVDDVVTMLVRSLDPSIQGNQDFLANSHSPNGIQWDRSFDIVKQHFPKECEDGVFAVETTERPKSVKFLIDSSKAEQTFGFTFKSFEEQVLDTTAQYLRLKLHK